MLSVYFSGEGNICRNKHSVELLCPLRGLWKFSNFSWLIFTFLHLPGNVGQWRPSPWLHVTFITCFMLWHLILFLAATYCCVCPSVCKFCFLRKLQTWEGWDWPAGVWVLLEVNGEVLAWFFPPLRMSLMCPHLVRVAALMALVRKETGLVHTSFPWPADTAPSSRSWSSLIFSAFQWVISVTKSLIDDITLCQVTVSSVSHLTRLFRVTAYTACLFSSVHLWLPV